MSLTYPTAFKSGRQFAAFLRLVPRQNSTEGKSRLGRISKMGNGYLRKLLVIGATSVLRRARIDESSATPRLHDLLERKPVRLVTIAVAYKTPRTAWALTKQEEIYRKPSLA